MVAFTGLGSLPGTDFGAALRMTFDKVPELPYLPELPARGPWAAMIGRGLGLPSGLPASLEECGSMSGIASSSRLKH